MDDSVLVVHHSEVVESEIGCIFSEGFDLCPADRVLDGLVLVVRRRVVVRHTEDFVRPEAFEASLPHSFESLRRSDFMAVKPVDIELSGSVFHVLHHMGVPNLIEKCVHIRLFY